MGWVMAGLGFHGLDIPKFIRPMTHPSSGPPQPSPFPARPIGLGQGSAMGWWAEPKPMRTILPPIHTVGLLAVFCRNV